MRAPPPAQIYVTVGEYDAAIDQLELLLSIPEQSLSLGFESIPSGALRDHPRFQALLEREQ